MITWIQFACKVGLILGCGILACWGIWEARRIVQATLWRKIQELRLEIDASERQLKKFKN